MEILDRILDFGSNSKEGSIVIQEIQEGVYKLGSVKIENGSAKFDPIKDSTDIEYLSSKPLHFSEIRNILRSRLFNYPGFAINKKSSWFDVSDPDLSEYYFRTGYSYNETTGQLSLFSSMFDMNKDIPRVDLDEIDEDVKIFPLTDVTLTRDDEAVDISLIEKEYNKLFGSMSELEEINLFGSFKNYVDLLNNSITINLVDHSSSIFTNTIDFEKLKNYATNINGIKCKVDLSVSYTKLGNIYTGNLVFVAFEYTEQNYEIVCIENNYRSIINDGDVEIEYLNGILKVIPHINTVSECIISNCLVTYGNF